MCATEVSRFRDTCGVAQLRCHLPVGDPIRMDCRHAVRVTTSGPHDSALIRKVEPPMKTQAAVAFAAGKPLEVVTLDLDGPKAREVLVQLKATGICHTDEFTRSGADPEGIFPAIFG